MHCRGLMSNHAHTSYFKYCCLPKQFAIIFQQRTIGFQIRCSSIMTSITREHYQYWHWTNVGTLSIHTLKIHFRLPSVYGYRIVVAFNSITKQFYGVFTSLKCFHVELLAISITEHGLRSFSGNMSYTFAWKISTWNIPCMPLVEVHYGSNVLLQNEERVLWLRLSKVSLNDIWAFDTFNHFITHEFH